MKKTFKNILISKPFNIGLFKYGWMNKNWDANVTVRNMCHRKIKDTLRTSIDIDNFLEVYYFNFHKVIYCDSMSTVAYRRKKKSFKYLGGRI